MMIPNDVEIAHFFLTYYVVFGICIASRGLGRSNPRENAQERQLRAQLGRPYYYAKFNAVFAAFVGLTQDIADRDGSRTIEGTAGRSLDHGQHDKLLVGTKVSQASILSSRIFPAVTTTMLVLVGIGVLE